MHASYRLTFVCYFGVIIPSGNQPKTSELGCMSSLLVIIIILLKHNLNHYVSLWELILGKNAKINMKSSYTIKP